MSRLELVLTWPENLCLPYNRDYFVVKWSKDGKEVYFSATQQGYAICMHLAAERKSRASLRDAVEDFVCWVFDECEWCKMIIGSIKERSVVNLAKNCGFEVFEYPHASLVTRSR